MISMNKVIKRNQAMLKSLGVKNVVMRQRLKKSPIYRLNSVKKRGVDCEDNC